MCCWLLFGCYDGWVMGPKVRVEFTCLEERCGCVSGYVVCGMVVVGRGLVYV